jgi:hypothetical protein
MLFLFILLLLDAGRASTQRDTQHSIADGVVRAVELAFPDGSGGWADLLLYTPPFDKSIKTQAILVAEWALRMRIHNYGNLCRAYGEASFAAASRLAAPPVPLIKPHEIPTIEMATAICRQSPASTTLTEQQRKLMLTVARLRDVWPSKK